MQCRVSRRSAIAVTARATCLRGVLAVAIFSSAAGQSAETDTDGYSLQQVVVTGSRIVPQRHRHASASANNHLRADRQQRYTSISDVLHAAAISIGKESESSFNGSFAAGGSGVSLRGLTVDATLVLIDGHRMVNYPISDDGERSFVDVANLPESIIDRVEVLKDGASAVYGSDAIAGVVNIILKKSLSAPT